MPPRAIELKNRPPLRYPAICAPLVARTRQAVLDEAATVAAKKPDLIEWRVDFFNDIADTQQVVELVGRIKESTGGIPLLFTRRSSREGGERIPLSEAQVIELYRAVCETRRVDLLDFEMANDHQDIITVREFTHAYDVKLVMSFHDFHATPTLEQLTQRFGQGDMHDADVIKIAVMPHSMEDVLTLMTATLQASRALSVPVVSMAMGRLGAVTRLCGWAFGSAMTFAVGEASSAPGQMPIADVAAAIEILQKALTQQDL